MAHLTADIGRFVAQLNLDSAPERARAIAKTGFVDCYAVMVAGAREPVVGLRIRFSVHTGRTNPRLCLSERAAAGRDTFLWSKRYIRPETAKHVETPVRRAGVAGSELNR
jgi:hypothetical protein